MSYKEGLTRMSEKMLKEADLSMDLKLDYKWVIRARLDRVYSYLKQGNKGQAAYTALKLVGDANDLNGEVRGLSESLTRMSEAMDDERAAKVRLMLDDAENHAYHIAKAARAAGVPPRIISKIEAAKRLLLDSINDLAKVL